MTLISFLHQLSLFCFVFLYFIGLMNEIVSCTDGNSLIAHLPLGIFNMSNNHPPLLMSLKRQWFWNTLIYIQKVPLRVCNVKSSNKMESLVCCSYLPSLLLKSRILQTSESEQGNKLRSKQMPVRTVVLFSWVWSC